MRVKNTSGRALEVDGGRILAAGEFGDVNSRDADVAAHLDAGRLTRPSRQPAPPPPDRGDDEIGGML